LVSRSNDGVSISVGIWECGAQLLANPASGRLVGDIELQNLAPVVVDDEETVQQAESDRGHGEEVHCGDSLAVIL
jgi:hypothetical protein